MGGAQSSSAVSAAPTGPDMAPPPDALQVRVAEPTNSRRSSLSAMRDALLSLTASVARDRPKDIPARIGALASPRHSLDNTAAMQKDVRTGEGMDSAVLATYVPHAVVELFREATQARTGGGGGALGPDGRRLDQVVYRSLNAAVLFADMSGFTPLSRRLQEQGQGGVEELSRVLCDYFGQLVSEVESYGGDVLKFAGDALLITWTAPMSPSAPAAPAPAPAPAAQPRRRSLVQAMVGAVRRRSSTVGVDDGLPAPPASLTDLVERAAAAAQSCHHLLNGYSPCPDIVLTLHSGLSAGTLVELHVGGMRGRWEYLVQGPTLAQLGAVVDAAGTGEICLCPSASTLLRAKGVQMAEVPETGGIYKLEGAVSVPKTNPVYKQAGPELSSHLGSYLPSHILSHIRSGMDAGMAELRTVSVMFVNLPEFSFDPAAGPEKLEREAQQFQAIIRAAQSAVLGLQGHVRQLIRDDKGTVLIAVFGLQSAEGNVTNCVRAALDFHVALHDLLAECHSAGTWSGVAPVAEADASIGITTGPVFCGAVGSSKRREFAVVGHSVNMSARLMCKANGFILCDRNTKEAVLRSPFRTSVRIEFDEGPTLHLKGNNGPTDVFTPRLVTETGASDTDNEDYFTMSMSAVTVVGRRPELAMVRRFMDYAVERMRADKKVGVMHFLGAQGSGKATMVQALRREAIKRQVEVLACRPDHGMLLVPFAPLRPIIVQMLRNFKWPEEHVWTLGGSGSNGTGSGFNSRTATNRSLDLTEPTPPSISRTPPAQMQDRHDSQNVAGMVARLRSVLSSSMSDLLPLLRDLLPGVSLRETPVTASLAAEARVERLGDLLQAVMEAYARCASAEARGGGGGPSVEEEGAAEGVERQGTIEQAAELQAATGFRGEEQIESLVGLALVFEKCLRLDPATIKLVSRMALSSSILVVLTSDTQLTGGGWHSLADAEKAVTTIELGPFNLAEIALCVTAAVYPGATLELEAEEGEDAGPSHDVVVLLEWPPSSAGEAYLPTRTASRASSHSEQASPNGSDAGREVPLRPTRVVLNADLPAFVLERSQGSPLFVTQLTKQLCGSAYIVPMSSEVENEVNLVFGKSPDERGALPSSLRDVVGARIDDLPVHTQLLLKLCSTIGSVVDMRQIVRLLPRLKSVQELHVLKEVLGDEMRTVFALVQHFEVLVEAEFLTMLPMSQLGLARHTVFDRTFAFTSQLVREVCLDRMLYSDRASVHLLLAEFYSQELDELSKGRSTGGSGAAASGSSNTSKSASRHATMVINSLLITTPTTRNGSLASRNPSRPASRSNSASGSGPHSLGRMASSSVGRADDVHHSPGSAARVSAVASGVEPPPTSLEMVVADHWYQVFLYEREPSKKNEAVMKAVRFLHLAGLHAAESCATAQALETMELALELYEEVDDEHREGLSMQKQLARLLACYAPAACSTFGMRRAQPAYQRLVQIAPEFTTNPCEFHTNVARFLLLMSRPKKGRVQQCYELAINNWELARSEKGRLQTLTPVQVVESNHLMWVVLLRSGQYQAARMCIDDAIVAYSPERHPTKFAGHDPGVCGFNVRTLCAVVSGALHDSGLRPAEAIEHAHKVNHVLSVLHAYAWTAMTMAFARRFDLVDIQSAIELAAELEISMYDTYFELFQVLEAAESGVLPSSDVLRRLVQANPASAICCAPVHELPLCRLLQLAGAWREGLSLTDRYVAARLSSGDGEFLMMGEALRFRATFQLMQAAETGQVSHWVEGVTGLLDALHEAKVQVTPLLDLRAQLQLCQLLWGGAPDHIELQGLTSDPNRVTMQRSACVPQLALLEYSQSFSRSNTSASSGDEEAVPKVIEIPLPEAALLRLRSVWGAMSITQTTTLWEAFPDLQEASAFLASHS